MDETTFKILNAITDDLGSAISINRLTNEIKKMNQTAYYKNIYDKIQDLKGQNDIILKKIGNSSTISLNFNNIILTDILAQMELIKKERISKDNAELSMIFLELETHLKQDFSLISSASIIDPKKNISLNRAEFLIILKEPSKKEFEDMPKHDPTKHIQNQKININSVMNEIQKIHNIKLDYLILTEHEFFELIRKKDYNSIKEMISKQITILYPQNYWSNIKKLMQDGINLEKVEEIIPSKLSENDLIYNLARFGYKEMGLEFKEGNNFCLEFIIVSILMKDDARRIEAIPMLLEKAKNSNNRPIYNLLIFFCMKYNKLRELYGLLIALNKIKKNIGAEAAMEILEKMKISAKNMDETSIREKMELYYGD